MQAYIGGIVPMSVVDLQKNTYIQIFLAGCNFNCQFCNKPSLLSFNKEYLIDTKQIFSEIEKAAPFIKTVYLLGGEPLLQKDFIKEALKLIKKFNLKSVIETNGSQPKILKTIIKENLIDQIFFDIKCPLEEDFFQKVTKSKTFFINTTKIISNIKESLEILKPHNQKITFKTTIIPGLIFRKEDILKIARIIYENNKNSKWTLQQFKNDNIKNKKFSEIIPPSKEFMYTLRQIIIEKYPNLEITIKT
jgi:pyruvate formate lyase activating enzyme